MKGARLMRTLTTRILLSLLILTAPTAFAAPREVPATELKTLFQPYASVSELDVDFRQTKTIRGLKTPLKSTGHLKVRQPDLVEWTVLKPSYLQARMQGRKMTLTTGQGENQRTQAVPESETGSLSALVAWMRFDVEQLAKDYTVTELGSNWYSFVPQKPESAPLNKIDVELGPERKLKTLVLHEKSGDQIEIAFESPKVKNKK